MEAAIRKLVPPLSYGARKGQMGRIGVLGGSADFTGAPYYAGMASLKVCRHMHVCVCVCVCLCTVPLVAPSLDSF